MMSSLSASAASSILLLALVVVLTIAAMVSTTASSVPVPVVDHRDDVNTTTMLTNNDGSVTTTSPSAENWEMYYCFLCTGRHPLLIHYCPIYWDECHLNCWDAIPDDPSAPPAPVPPSSSVGSSAPGKECYVMKVYMSGRYVIVQRLNCDYVAAYACFLTCGGGELVADHQKVAMGTTATTVPATTTTTTTTTAAIQGSFVPFELCNTQVNALRAPPSAGVVVDPAGGAH